MIVPEIIEQYISNNSSQEDSLLAELNRETHIKAINPRMLSGHLQGRFLEILSKLMNPQYILEIGTYTGYSGICLARGLRPEGHMHTIEINDEIIRFPKKYFEKAGISDKTTIHIGDALEIIPKLDIEFDLIFIDADKQQYTDYYELCFSKLKPGGIILTDNVLWDGKVVEDNAEDPDTKAILEFNSQIANDIRVEVILIPLRDGLSVIRKK